MKIIALKKLIDNADDFLKNSKALSYLDGISIDVTMTKDGYIIPFNYSDNDDIALETVQNSNFLENENINVITFDQMLNIFDSWNKKIIINILPLLTPIINDDNIETINHVSEYFINQIFDTIEKHPNLKIQLASSSRRLLYYIKKRNKNYNIGFLLTTDDLSFEDVDFFIFNVLMFNVQIMEEQISRGKDIFMQLFTSSEISLFMKFFDQKNLNAQKKRVLDNITIISPYPEIINRVMNS